MDAASSSNDLKFNKMMEAIKMNAIAALMAALVWGTGCVHPKNLEYKGTDHLKFLGIAQGKVNVGADVRLLNPNKFGLTLKKVDLDVAVDGSPAGKAILPKGKYRIPKGAEFELPVIASAELKAGMANIGNVLFGRMVKIRVDGYVKAGKGFFFIRVPVHFEAEQKI